jgi:DNA-binding transcriptional regulator YiaG
MANLLVSMKDFVRRLAKREIKADLGSTKKAVSQYRRDIAALKRQVQTQTKEIAFLKSQEHKRLGQPTATATAEPSEGLRFSARSVFAQRKRLKLTRQQYAKLIGVAPLTIFNWEKGVSRPREAQFAALVAVRDLGRREALAKLELLEAETKKPRAKRRKIGRRKPK